MDNDKFNSAYEQAKAWYAQGQDNKYIELQLADKNVSDDIIDVVISKIKDIRKSERRATGRKLLIYGLSFVCVSIIATVLTFKSDSPIRFVCWGTLVVGVTTTVKGLTNILGW